MTLGNIGVTLHVRLVLESIEQNNGLLLRRDKESGEWKFPSIEGEVLPGESGACALVRLTSKLYGIELQSVARVQPVSLETSDLLVPIPFWHCVNWIGQLLPECNPATRVVPIKQGSQSADVLSEGVISHMWVEKGFFGWFQTSATTKRVYEVLSRMNLSYVRC